MSRKRLMAGLTAVTVGIGVLSYGGYDLYSQGVRAEGQPLMDANDNWQSPVHFYGPVELSDLSLAPPPQVVAAIKAKTDFFNKSSDATSQTPAANQSFASEDTLGKALAEIQTAGDVKCPEDSRYKVTASDDPSFLPCLDLSSAHLVQYGDQIEVEARPVMSPSYDKVLDLPQALQDPSAAKQCEAITTTLQQYGRFLLEGTGLIPKGQTAPVGIVLDYTTLHSCDSHATPAPAATPTNQGTGQ